MRDDGAMPQQLLSHRDRQEDLPNFIEDINSARKYIESIDFEPIKDLLAQAGSGLGWSREKLDFVERHYRNFLFLWRKYPDESLPPSEDVDEFWHAHILDTRAYLRDTAAVFGRYLHHYPYFGTRGDEDAALLSQSWDRVQEIHEREFGEPVYAYEDEHEDG